MIFDHSKLEGKMREKHVTQKDIADIIKNAVSTVCLKLQGKAKFTEKDIILISNFLGISKEEIPEYFFVEKV